MMPVRKEAVDEAQKLADQNLKVGDWDLDTISDTDPFFVPLRVRQTLAHIQSHGEVFIKKLLKRSD